MKLTGNGPCRYKLPWDNVDPSVGVSSKSLGMVIFLYLKCEGGMVLLELLPS